jgi:hypothetical protein
MDVSRSSETLVPYHITAKCHNPEDRDFKGDALWAPLFNFASECAIWKAQQNRETQSKVAQKILVCADDVKILGEVINTLKRYANSIIRI